MSEKNNTNSMITALAVLITIAAVFYAGMMHGKSGTVAPSPPTAGDNAPPPGPPPITPDIDVLMIQDNDAVRGSGDIVLVEYSDFGCGYCKRFHPTVQTLVDNGEVAWVYRHLSFRAREGAIISECVKEHKGKEAFWAYTDSVFALETGALNFETFKSLGRDAGLSDTQMDACLLAGSNAQKTVEQQMNDAQNMGVNGTPGSFLINTKTKAVQSIPGALPLTQIQGILEAVR